MQRPVGGHGGEVLGPVDDQGEVKVALQGSIKFYEHSQGKIRLFFAKMNCPKFILLKLTMLALELVHGRSPGPRFWALITTGPWCPRSCLSCSFLLGIISLDHFTCSPTLPNSLLTDLDEVGHVKNQ